MSTAHLKNKITNEIKAVERGSEEYLELAAQRITRDRLKDMGDDAAGVEAQPHRPLWEDRGVAAHAELGLEPAVGNINDRNYNDEDDYEPADDELATGSDRIVHANHEAPSNDEANKATAPSSKFARYRDDEGSDEHENTDNAPAAGRDKGDKGQQGEGSAAQRAAAAGAGS